jgi:hypothetical protein
LSIVLFIDTNPYLDLYRMIAGRKLLAPLEEQKAHIFVSAQIRDEVLRNKLGCAGSFFSDQFKGTTEAGIPDHLLGIADERIAELRGAFKKASTASDELVKLAGESLSQISRSEDEIYGCLSKIFESAVSPSETEMQRARARREIGNPPGKPADPLGDQITWEQLLTHCNGNEIKRLWIITRDKDFHIKWKKSLHLNARLYQDLANACAGVAPEIYCFDYLADGIFHFGRNAGVPAKTLPTDAEAEIKKETEALPPWGYSTSGIDDATMVVINNQQMRARNFVAAFASGAGGWTPTSLLFSPTAEGGTGNTLTPGAEGGRGATPVSTTAKPSEKPDAHVSQYRDRVAKSRTWDGSGDVDYLAGKGPFARYLRAGLERIGAERP